jgi:5-methylcytosine-specific restriction endonuclease McrBC GTP-binding regulatory subunit McrB
MVRQLARGCCPRFRSGTDEDHPLYDEQKPGNFEMIPVRPNWHDSTELMGYVSRISGSPKYVITDFIRFLAKAWLYEKEGIPFFLCLDEMNLAPVEQYFAEFLSVIETRKKDEDGRIVTDTLVKISDEPLLKSVIDDVYKDVEHNAAENFKAFFVSTGGLPIPSNLVVMGTVNMDETTCTFSRKVLDRAMSFELNDVSDMYDLSNIEDEGDYEFGTIDSAAAKQSLTTGKEACDTAKDICGKVLGYLKAVNEKLDKTAFKIAYRSRNEIMIYCLERINGDVVSLAEALDEVTSMKILSRIEGDSQHVTEKWLGELSELISAELAKVDGYDESKCNICRDKLNDMKEQVQSGYTSFWMR